MGKVEEVSVDSEVNTLKSRMFEQDKKLKHLNDTFLRYLDALKGNLIKIINDTRVLSAAQMNLAEEISNLMNEQDQSLQSVLFKTPATRYLKYMRTIDTERVRVVRIIFMICTYAKDEHLRKCVVDTISQYSRQVSQLEVSLSSIFMFPETIC